jgi:hypothetical protein
MDFNGFDDKKNGGRDVLRLVGRNVRFVAAGLAVALVVSVASALAAYGPGHAFRSAARTTVTPPSGKKKGKCVTKKQKKTKYCKAKAKKAKQAQKAKKAKQAKACKKYKKSCKQKKSKKH